MNGNNLQRWGKALIVTLVLFVIYAGYLYVRRESWSLSNFNKSFASTAVLLAGFTLLIRPLSARIAFFYRFMTIRRQLGLLAFVLGAIHIVISLFFIPTRFTLAWYQQEWVGVVFGVVAILVWIYLAFISRNQQIIALGSDRWQRLQSTLGRIAFFLVYLHLIHLKYSGWVTWFTTGENKSSFLANPQYIQESFLVFIVMTVIILIKLIQIIRGGGDKHGNNTVKQIA